MLTLIPKEIVRIYLFNLLTKKKKKYMLVDKLYLLSLPQNLVSSPILFKIPHQKEKVKFESRNNQNQNKKF